jgi:hypothetical protein
VQPLIIPYHFCPLVVGYQYGNRHEQLD